MTTGIFEQDTFIAALRAARDEILARWIAAVSLQTFHQRAPERAVTDHMPRLLDVLLQALDGGADASHLGHEAALGHAAVRAEQGLDSGDMVTEFGLLRAELQRTIGAHAGPDVGTLLAAEFRIHTQLDALVVVALREFDGRVRARMEALAALAAARADTLGAVIGAMPDGVFVADTSGKLVMLNRAGGELIGVPINDALEPLTHAAPIEIRAPDGRPLAKEDYPIARALRGEVRTNDDYLIRRLDTGEDRLLRVALAPIRDKQGAITGGIGAITGAVCVTHDVTMLRRLERDRDEFVSRASHELKTPLTSATGLLQLARRRLARQADDPLGLAPMLETAQQQVDRLAVLVDDLRSVSQLRAGQIQIRTADLDLRPLVEQAAQALQATTEQHTLRVALPDEPLMLRGDATRLAQVLDNLLSNAIKYSPSGGEIWVRCERRDGQAVIEVEDRGIGVPAEDRATLFEPFHRASNANQASTGMGLGLYISRELARRHGGDLRLARSGAGGSVFALTLPLIDPAP